MSGPAASPPVDGSSPSASSASLDALASGNFREARRLATVEESTASDEAGRARARSIARRLAPDRVVVALVVGSLALFLAVILFNSGSFAR